MYTHIATCDRCGHAESWTAATERPAWIPDGFTKLRITAENRMNAGRTKIFLICQDCQVRMDIAPAEGHPGELNKGIEARFLEIITELINHTQNGG